MLMSTSDINDKDNTGKTYNHGRLNNSLTNGKGKKKFIFAHVATAR